jgi:hypothetical protein
VTRAAPRECTTTRFKKKKKFFFFYFSIRGANSIAMRRGAGSPVRGSAAVPLAAATRSRSDGKSQTSRSVAADVIAHPCGRMARRNDAGKRLDNLIVVVAIVIVGTVVLVGAFSASFDGIGDGTRYAKRMRSNSS